MSEKEDNMFPQGLERRKWIIGLVSVLFVLAGCVCSLLAGTSVLLALSSTPGMGVPVVSGDWEITVNSAHEESALMDFSMGTYTPPPGDAFLVVDVALRNLDASQETKVSADAFAVIDQAREIIRCVGMGDSESKQYVVGLGSYSMSNENSQVLNDVALIFVVKKDRIGRALRLQFQDGPRIALAVNQK